MRIHSVHPLKLFIAIALVVSILGCSILSTAKAVNDPPVSPNAIEVCNGLPYHKMDGKGAGFVYVNGEVYINGGQAWQCAHCNQVLVTEGRIIFNQMSTIGRWAEFYAHYRINESGISINAPSAYGVNNSNSMVGYLFT